MAYYDIEPFQIRFFNLPKCRFFNHWCNQKNDTSLTFIWVSSQDWPWRHRKRQSPNCGQGADVIADFLSLYVLLSLRLSVCVYVCVFDGCCRWPCRQRDDRRLQRTFRRWMKAARQLTVLSRSVAWQPALQPERTLSEAEAGCTESIAADISVITWCDGDRQCPSYTRNTDVRISQTPVHFQAAIP